MKRIVTLMEVSMNLKKRAADAITIAVSLVVMTSAAGAVPTDMGTAQTTTTDLATNGIAGIAKAMGQYGVEESDSKVILAANVEQTVKIRVASAGAASELYNQIAVYETEMMSQTNSESELETGLGTVVESELQSELVAAESAKSESEIKAESVVESQLETKSESVMESETESEVALPSVAEEEIQKSLPEQSLEELEELTKVSDDMQQQEELDWQERLMADVDQFLYVRENAAQDAQIVGKLYKGDVADIQEIGSEWTHIKSGNVDGYVSNAYCLTGTDALDYAKENFDTEAEVLTNGLRIRSEANEDSAVITALSEGTVLKVQQEENAVTDDGWVAVAYNGTTRYVSADYVSLSLSLGEAITLEEEQEEQKRLEAEEKARKSTQVTSVATVQKEAVQASVDDVTLLAAIIQCEAGNEIYEGQLAVGAVVMNRVRSGSYPSSIYDVIYQKGQFPPAGAGSVANIAAKGPKQSCLQAAQEALNGADNTGGATRFKRASSGHAGVVIGNHVFY